MGFVSSEQDGPASHGEVLLVRTPRAAIAALVVTVIELFVLNAGFNALVPARYFRPELPILQALKARAPTEPFRVAGLDWAFLPNASAQYGLEDIRGSDPMSLDSYMTYLRPLTTRDPSTDLDRLVVTDDLRLKFLGVRFLIAEPGASFGSPWTQVYSGPDGTLFENRDAFPRFFGVGAEVKTTDEGAGRYLLQVKTESPMSILSSLPAAPGWRVVCDGHPVETDAWSGQFSRPKTVSAPAEDGRGAFLTFRVPAGTRQVEVVYRPRSFYLSLYASATALLLLVLLSDLGNRPQTPQVMPGPCTGPDL